MRRLFQLRIFAVMAVVGFVLAASAHAGAETIVQSYKADGNIPPGWLVSLEPDSSDTIELTPANQSNQIYGVTIDPSQAPVTEQRQSDQQVFVANSGIYPLLVSTQNGAIHAGDYISISSTAGIAAKATSNQVLVIGQAAAAFNGTSGVLSSGGGIAVGKIPVTIAPGRNPLLKNDLAIPAVIRRIGTSIAGKDITALRIYVSLAVFIAAAVMAIIILLAGIRSSMISIGRNPLSRSSILRALTEVVIAAIAVLALGIVAVYLLLRL